MAEAVAATSRWAGQPVAAQEIQTWCVTVRPHEMSVDQLAARLRNRKPLVAGRVQEDRVLLDLRSVLPRQDTQLVAALEAIENAES